MKTHNVTTLQKMLWFEWKMRPHSNGYNNVYIYKLHSEINLDQLNKSLTTIHKQFPILFAKFEESIYGIKQRQISLELINVSIMQSKSELFKFLYSAFDLNQNYLFRYAIYSQNTETYLGFCWHHIIADAHTVNTILNILGNLLSGKKSCYVELNQLDLSELSEKQEIRYKKNLLRAKEYWEKALLQFTPSLLKTNFLIENNKRNAAKRIVFSLLENEKNLIMNNVGSFVTTLFIYVASCIAKVFLDQTRHDKLTLGFTQNCREKDYPDQMGNFAVLLPLLIERCSDLKSLIKAICEHISFCKSHDQFMLPDIHKLYRSQSKQNTTKLFNVSLNYGVDFGTQFLGVYPEIHNEFECTNDLIIRFEYVNTNKNNSINSTIMFELDYNTNNFSDDDIQMYLKNIITQLISAT